MMFEKGSYLLGLLSGVVICFVATHFFAGDPVDSVVTKAPDTVFVQHENRVSVPSAVDDFVDEASYEKQAKTAWFDEPERVEPEIDDGDSIDTLISELMQLDDGDARYELMSEVRGLSDSQKQQIADALLYSSRDIDQVSGVDIALAVSEPSLKQEQAEQLLQSQFSATATERLLDHIAADTELQSAGYIPDLLAQFVAVADDPILQLSAMRSVSPSYENRDQLYQSLMPLLNGAQGAALDSTLLVADRWVVDSYETVFSSGQVQTIATRITEIANDSSYSVDQRIQALQLSKRF